jgi:hypothetical protein
MRTVLFWDIMQRVVVNSSDVSGQSIRPTFKGKELKKKAGNPSTGFIQGRVWAATSSRVDVGVRVLGSYISGGRGGGRRTL